MSRCNKKEKERLLGIEPKYLLGEVNWNEDPNPIPDYLCFVSEELGAKITVSATRYSFTANLEYSTDKVNWVNFPITEYFTSGDIPLEQNVPIYLRGDNPDGFSKDKQKYFGFQFNKNTSCSGNIMTLIKKDGNTDVIPNAYCFYRLFSFTSGNKLLSAPKLPATTLQQGCYENLFWDCTLLAVAPELPATNLVDSCYNSMFKNTSITTSPILPAKTLAIYCYYEMFAYCTSLQKIYLYAEDVSAQNCLNNWLYRASDNGIIYNLGGASIPTDSTSGVPTGWTEYTTLPE